MSCTKYSESKPKKFVRSHLTKAALPKHAGDRHTAISWLSRLEEGEASSNVEAQELPFQRWYRFKEAFSPRFVSTAIGSLKHRPTVCLDPFGGSGTTALTCQFLGIQPATIELNPFLADLIESKLSAYDLLALIRDYARIIAASRTRGPDPHELLRGAPATFVEPGQDDRWIFNHDVAAQLLAYRESIAELPEGSHRRLLRVLLGSIAIKLSNVTISGKGRRYRMGWPARRIKAADVDHAFREAFEEAVRDISRYGRRAEPNYTLLRGDARQLIREAPPAEFSLFSPPYPNSFDYTDIYNVELWLLGYLNSSKDNRTLREATMRSHVQIKRSYECDWPKSRLLKKTIDALGKKNDKLWDADIPAMVTAYFADLASILRGLAATMAPNGQVMMVVGDSLYAGVRVDVAGICSEMAPTMGFEVKYARPIRGMRASPQQGGRRDLSETLIHFSR